jgi:hypothetical protein
MPGFAAAAAAARDKKTVVSDALIAESTGEQSTTSLSYVKKKVIGMPSNRVRTTVRITFTLKSATAGVNARGELYYNGVVIGTAQSTTSATYVTKSEDIQIDCNGGTIELWLNTGHASHAAYSDNLSIKGDETEIAQNYEVIT